jgi:hypothetical protein
MISADISVKDVIPREEGVEGILTQYWPGNKLLDRTSRFAPLLP